MYFDYIEKFYSRTSSVDLKSDINLIINSNIDWLVLDRQINKDLFYLYSSLKDVTYDNVLFGRDKVYQKYKYYFDNFKKELLLAHKYNNNFYRRQSRVKKRISFMLSNYSCLFLTFTFDDNCLKRTSLDTRRRYITRALRTLNCYCVGNIDFGNGNKYIDFQGIERIGTFREHYHVIVSVGNIDNINKKFWKYGGVNFERIVTTDSNTDLRTSKYLMKLCNHTFKTSTDYFNNSVIFIKPNRVKNV